jgi:rhamnosyltransferase
VSENSFPAAVSLRRFFQAQSGSFGPYVPGGLTRIPAQEARSAASVATVLVVVVCYEPDRDHLTALIECLKHQDGVCALLVDNSELEVGRVATAAIARGLGVPIVANARNLGVAAAQNIGVREAARLGVDFVLFLDQDSQPEPDMAQRLIAAYQGLRQSGLPVAAVGPSFVDPRCNLSFPFARLRHFRMETTEPPAGHAVECDILISSGCLVSMEALRAVGEMDEALFIDYVDIEWCLRARSTGWKVFGVADARMHHTIGDRAVKLFGRVIAIHNPVRHYYLIRNALLFARKPYLTWRWRTHLVYRVAGQFVIFGLLCPQRLRRLGWMLRGALDGVLGIDGRLGGPSGLGRPWRARLAGAPSPCADAARAEQPLPAPVRD